MLRISSSGRQSPFNDCLMASPQKRHLPVGLATSDLPSLFSCIWQSPGLVRTAPKDAECPTVVKVWLVITFVTTQTFTIRSE